MKKLISTIILIGVCGCVSEKTVPIQVAAPTPVVSATTLKLEELEQRIAALELVESNRTERLIRAQEIREKRAKEKASQPMTRQERIDKNLTILGRRVKKNGGKK